MLFFSEAKGLIYKREREREREREETYAIEPGTSHWDVRGKTPQSREKTISRLDVSSLRDNFNPAFNLAKSPRCPELIRPVNARRP